MSLKCSGMCNEGEGGLRIVVYPMYSFKHGVLSMIKN